VLIGIAKSLLYQHKSIFTRLTGLSLIFP
jgi:hypothetical protein